jgi:hypothetical protein
MNHWSGNERKTQCVLMMAVFIERHSPNENRKLIESQFLTKLNEKQSLFFTTC